MPKIITQEEYIKSAKKIHGDKYDYSKVNYKKNDEKIEIICNKHGSFFQEANAHKRGHGCKKCVDEKKFLTRSKFIKQANKVHKGKFDYSLTEFSKTHQTISIEIICPIHGKFFQRVRNHLRGDDCRKCAAVHRGLKQRITKEYFIQTAQKFHGNKYDYSKVQLSTSRDVVKIVCPTHGQFKQIAEVHYRHGCKKCGHLKAGKIQRLSLSEFIKKSNIKHKNKYDYSKVNYENSNTLVQISCPIHGEFKQTPKLHMRGRGCIFCGGSKPHTNKSFIKEAKYVHKNKYDYTKVNYENSHSHIIIICPKHGEFNQTPTGHLSGAGCSKCTNKSEGRIAELLVKKNIVYREFIIEMKKCDFYLPELNLIIERDGEQHYKDSQIRGAKLLVGEQQENDKFKTKLAKDAGFKIARIPYWLTKKEEEIEIENILAGKPTYPDVPDLSQEDTKPRPKVNYEKSNEK